MVAKRRTVVAFWTRLGSLRLKSVNSHRDRGGPAHETQNCRHFWTSSRLFASQKCQQSQGSGGVVVVQRRAVVTFGLVSSLRVSKVSTVTGIGGGRGRATQSCRHFWTRLVSAHLKSVNSHRGSGGVVVVQRRAVVTFGLVSSLRISKVSTVTGDRGGSWSRNAELSSVLDSSRGLCVSKVSTVTGIGGVVVAKPRAVVAFGLVSSLRVSKVSTVTGIGGVVVAKRRAVVTVGLASGERKGERRKER